MYAGLSSYERNPAYRYIVPAVTALYGIFLNYIATCACMGTSYAGNLANTAGRAIALTTFLCIVTPLQLFIAGMLVAFAEPHFELGLWFNGTDNNIMYKTGWIYLMSTCVFGP